MPVAGSFHEYGSRFISSSFGFAIGWNYWFNWAVTVAAGEAKDPKQKYSKSYKCNILENFAILYICYFYHWYAFTFYRSKFAQKYQNRYSSKIHFTILFDRAGVAFAASVINAVIFTAIFSAINSAKPTSLKTKISMIYHFKAKWYPLGPILALIMCVIVIIGQNYEALIQGRDFVTLLTSYIGLWLFLLIWAGYKLITKSKAIDPLQADIKRYNY